MKHLSNKIAVAVDFSPYTKPAVSYAIDLACLLDYRLVLINVVDKRDYERLRRWSSELGNHSGSLFTDDPVKERTSELELLAAEALERGVQTETKVLVDVPFRGVLAGVAETKANLLIISTKGRTNLSDVLVGSCASKLFRRSPVPVLSIPAVYVKSMGLADE
jgi:nucleotide-binding universal stress UspA family protein